MKNKYIRTNWKDHIVDIEQTDEDGNPLVIQEGTRFTASRANNIEEGIYNAYGELIGFEDELTKIRIQLEMLGRAPTNNGTFFDPIGDEEQAKALRLMTQSAISQNALGKGATEITVDNPENVAIGQEIVIFDEEVFENNFIEGIEGGKLIVGELDNSYKKGAYVMRSNVIKKKNKLFYSEWGTYGINIKEVI